VVKSVGLAIQDWALAHALATEMERQALGQSSDEHS